MALVGAKKVFQLKASGFCTVRRAVASRHGRTKVATARPGPGPMLDPNSQPPCSRIFTLRP